MPTTTQERPTPVSSNGQQPADSSENNTLCYYGTLLQSELKRHVIGQDPMVFAVTAAALAGINLCLVGKPGIGKTFTAETLLKILGFKGGLLPLNPEITATDITGNMILDLATHKKVYSPSPFLGDDLDNQMIILDELNRSSDKAQTALLDIIDKKRIIVDKVQYSLSDIYTIIMTMNPPECSGTRPTLSALDDRIDYSLMVRNPPQEDMQAIITSNRQPQPVKCLFRQPDQSPTDALTQLSSKYEAEAVLRDCRLTFDFLFSGIWSGIDVLASRIVDAFQGDKWQKPATVRTGLAIAKMATAVSYIQEAKPPEARHVWWVAPGCLGMLQPVDWMTTDDRLKLIADDLAQLKAEIG